MSSFHASSQQIFTYTCCGPRLNKTSPSQDVMQGYSTQNHAIVEFSSSHTSLYVDPYVFMRECAYMYVYLFQLKQMTSAANGNI